MNHKGNMSIERQLVSAIWSKKITIFLMVLIFGTGSVLVAVYAITPMYEIRTIIEPSKVRIFISEEKQEELILENPVSLAAKIREGVYDPQVKRAIKLPAVTKFHWRAVESKGTEKITVTLLWPEPEEGKQIVQQLIFQVENDLEMIVEQVAKKYNAGLNSYMAKVSAMTGQQSKISRNISSLQDELKVLSALRLTYEKRMVEQQKIGNVKNINDIFLLYTLSSRDLLESRANIVTEIAELQKASIENEMEKADSQKYYDMIASENDILKPLRISGGIESSVKPITMSKTLIGLSGAVVGLLLSLILVVIRRDKL